MSSLVPLTSSLTDTASPGVTGTTRFMPGEQSAYTFPTQTKDPSLGMPHQFLQIQDPAKSGLLIAPAPYDTTTFVLPPWMKA